MTRFVRFAAGSAIGYGIIADDGRYRAITTTPFLPWNLTDETFEPSEVRLLAPVLPSKVVCIGLNYTEHAKEMGKQLPEVPLMFLKPSTSVVGHGDPIVLPPGIGRVDHEAELGIVIGRALKGADVDEASEGILGYTGANDVSARVIQASDVQYTRAKGFDTFCPLGPSIVATKNFDGIAVKATVNNETRQDSSTGDLIFSVPELVSFVSDVMTLLPGDVLLTGTPPGVSEIHPGDLVTIEVGAAGELANPVHAAEH